uniref:Uncharacterized protein n=1 Tax=Anopheles culicifacies TaxID=139723 RepID=A0A182MA14_9DIPT
MRHSADSGQLGQIGKHRRGAYLQREQQPTVGVKRMPEQRNTRLGNQQFNHYPMKLPSSGCCDFLDNLQVSYGDNLHMLRNMPAVGECPFSPRSIDMINFAFPEKVLPRVMPRGLWKALKVVFENFVQLSGFDIVLMDLRVRKYNRTMTVLNGSFIVLNTINNSVEVGTNGTKLPSRLGNQQFNHYPMKLPSSGCCDFLDNLQISYQKQVSVIENLPAIGECPFAPRHVNMIDFAFPQEVVSRVMPRGLWKALVTAKLDGKVIITYYFLVKGYDDF